MKLIKILFLVWMVLLFGSSAAAAGDFDWIQGFNIQAEQDPSGFRARLAARFQIGNVQINTVLRVRCGMHADMTCLVHVKIATTPVADIVGLSSLFDIPVGHFVNLHLHQ